MSVIKILAIFVSCLAATNCLATSNVCCPWTKSCSCPKGLVVFKSPWICVNNKLWLLRKADKVYG